MLVMLVLALLCIQLVAATPFPGSKERKKQVSQAMETNEPTDAQVNEFYDRAATIKAIRDWQNSPEPRQDFDEWAKKHQKRRAASSSYKVTTPSESSEQDYIEIENPSSPLDLNLPPKPSKKQRKPKN